MTELSDYRLDAIRLENFMGYEDSGWVELRPITFVFGRNSSGKSALIRALLLLKQSMAAPNGDSPPLLFSGELVDLGTYYNTVRGHDKSRNIAFAFRVAHPRWPDPAPLPDNPSDEQRQAFDAQLALRKSRIPSWSQGDKGADVADSPFELRLEYGLLEGGEQARLKKCSVWGYRGSEPDPTPVLVFSLTYDEDGHAWLPDSEAPLDYDAPVPDYDDEGRPIMGDDEKPKYHSERRSKFSDQDWWPAAGINFYSTIVPTLILRDQVLLVDRKNAIVADLTTQVEKSTAIYDILLEEWAYARLRKQSTVHLSKLHTIHQDIFRRRVGKLADTDADRIKAAWQMLRPLDGSQKSK